MGVVLGFYQLHASSSVRATKEEYKAFVESQRGIVKDLKHYSYQVAKSQRLDLVPFLKSNHYQLIGEFGMEIQKKRSMSDGGTNPLVGDSGNESSDDVGNVEGLVGNELSDDGDNADEGDDEKQTSMKFETVTIMDHDCMPLPFAGIQGVDYELPTPMMEDMAQYYVKHNVWCLFQVERDENNHLNSYPELNGISIKDNSYIIPSVGDLIHICKFIAVAAAI
jgi:hypothetical protein